MGSFRKKQSEDYGSLEEMLIEKQQDQKRDSVRPWLTDKKSWKKKAQGNTGKNLVEKPYRKPTQVGGCGMH